MVIYQPTMPDLIMAIGTGSLSGSSYGDLSANDAFTIYEKNASYCEAIVNFWQVRPKGNQASKTRFGD